MPEFAQQNNFQIIEIYADRAISGKTDKRPYFQRMMRDAEKKSLNSNRLEIKPYGSQYAQAMMNEAVK